MNQRIRELYEQAHRVYEVPYEGSVVDPTIVAYHKHKVFDRDLFAELIVRECAEMMPQDNLYKMVLKHFGVEE
jgi:hypothetical protein